MRQSLLNLFYAEGRDAAPIILRAENRIAEQRRQYGFVLKALNRKRHVDTYRAFLRGYRDAVQQAESLGSAARTERTEN